MPTVQVHAGHVARDDQGRWRDAATRTADLLAASWEADRGQEPFQELRFNAMALVVYAVMLKQNSPATTIGINDLLTWMNENRVAQQHGLASELRRAGHEIPAPYPTQSPSYTGTDPVVSHWVGLTSWVKATETWDVADHFPGPNMDMALAMAYQFMDGGPGSVRTLD